MSDIILKPCDIVLVRGTSFISRMIRIFTRHIGEKRTKVNHVGMVILGGGSYLPTKFGDGVIIEALSQVKIRNLRQAYGPPNKADIAIYRPTNLSEEQLDIIWRGAMDHLNQRYGWPRVIAHALDRLFLGVYLFRRLIPHNKYPICSWLVAHAYSKVGKDFGVPVGTATPDDIWDFVAERGETPYVCIYPLGRLNGE